MKHSNCLSEQDLTLLHYGETPQRLSRSSAQRHLAECADCRLRQMRLARDLDALPAFEAELAPHNATRLAARVVDRLPRRRSLLPALAAAVSVAAIIFALNMRTPQPQPVQNVSLRQPAAVEPSAVPVDLLENLELLRELETLSEIVGV